MIRGSVVALVTPMHANGDVDWAALDKLIDFHIEQGTHVLGVVGTTGESPTLSWDENIEVVRRTVERAAGRVPVLAGTGANSTAEALAGTKRAKEVGADACLLVVPYYNKPTQEGMYRHFMTIADGADIPQMLYNVPGRTVADLLPETVERLAPHDNIVAIKDATGDIARGREMIAACGEQIDVLSGDDPTAMELMLHGGKGNVSVTANIAPKLMAQLCDAAIAGELATAQEINEKLNDLNNVLGVEANPIPIKWAMAEAGLIEDGIRLPLTWLSEQHHAAVRAALVKAGVLSV